MYWGRGRLKQLMWESVGVYVLQGLSGVSKKLASR